jgi:FkbM family methyltransferase
MIPKKTWRVNLIGKALRFVERFFFDPKLRRALQQALSKSKRPSDSIKRSLIFFDVGANRGQTIQSLKSIYPESFIYSFEPDPTIFKQLVSKNKWNSVIFFNIALGESTGRFPFYISPLDETSTLYLPTMDSIWNKKKATILGLNSKNMYHRIEVEVVTMDEIVLQQNIHHVDLLKIDVEGGELQVLEGAISSFNKGIVSVVQFETHNDDLRPSQKLKIEEFLIRKNFYKDSSIKHVFGNFHDEIWIKRI